MTESLRLRGSVDRSWSSACCGVLGLEFRVQGFTNTSMIFGIIRLYSSFVLSNTNILGSLVLTGFTFTSVVLSLKVGA